MITVRSRGEKGRERGKEGRRRGRGGGRRRGKRGGREGGEERRKEKRREKRRKREEGGRVWFEQCKYQPSIVSPTSYIGKEEEKKEEAADAPTPTTGRRSCRSELSPYAV